MYYQGLSFIVRGSPFGISSKDCKLYSKVFQSSSLSNIYSSILLLMIQKLSYRKAFNHHVRWDLVSRVQKAWANEVFYQRHGQNAFIGISGSCLTPYHKFSPDHSSALLLTVG